MIPLSILSRPPKTFNKVDFPHPDSPVRKVKPLLGILKLILFNATVSPAFLDL